MPSSSFSNKLQKYYYYLYALLTTDYGHPRTLSPDSFCDALKFLRDNTESRLTGFFTSFDLDVALQPFQLTCVIEAGIMTSRKFKSLE